MVKAKRRHRRKNARPSEILQAAIEEFSENGFAGAKVEAIAIRAGVAKGTVYLYYDTKEEIFEAIVRAKVGPVIHLLTKIVDRWDGSQSGLLKTILSRLYREMVQHDERRMILQTLISESARFEELAALYHAEVLVGLRKLIGQVIQDGIDQGEFRQTPVKNEPAVILGPVVFAAVWKMSFEQAERLKSRRWLNAHVDLVLHGLQAET